MYPAGTHSNFGSSQARHLALLLAPLLKLQTDQDKSSLTSGHVFMFVALRQSKYVRDTIFITVSGVPIYHNIGSKGCVI